MRRSKTDTAKRLAIGASIAAAAGYLAGILTAPKSGKATRDNIKDAAGKGFGEAEKQFRKLHDELDDLVSGSRDKSDAMSSKARKEFDSLVETAKDSKDKVGEIMRAVRRGKANDRDLKKAINDASKAVEHLRDYLSK